jgi:antitoxin (DNA-binding transcriptional repressor) of toxin-antitoxin stability system
MNAETPVDKATKIVTIHEAKTHLSRLLAEVEVGAEIVLARGRTPIARLVPLETFRPKRRVPNRFAHLIPPGKDILEDGFWDPLSPEHLGLGIEGEDLKG